MREVRDPATTRQAAIHLQRIATKYSRLSPFFARLRTSREFNGNTLLPNALSSIAPAMAYGFCGDLSHGQAKAKLDAIPEWKAASEEIAEEYRLYRDSSENALLWAGWNYWDPMQPTGSRSRVIQVIATEELLATRNDLMDPDRPLLKCNNKVFLKVRDFLRVPEGGTDTEVMLGKHRSDDTEFIPGALIEPRRFLHNIWRSVFVPSIELFNPERLPTIVDYLKLSSDLYGENKAIPLTRDFAAHFPRHAPSAEDAAADASQVFVCLPTWSRRLWDLVAENIDERSLGSLPGAATDQRIGALRFAWRNMAKSPALLKRLAEPLSNLRSILGPACRNEAMAYAIFQHLALFDRFLFGSNQYVFPISFGKHVFVAFLCMQEPLTKDDEEGWRQVVTALFGSLLVELLTKLTTAADVAGKLRRNLAHSLPKTIFKPLEFMALSINSNKLNGGQYDADAMIFLTRKGQSVLSEYVGSQHSNETPGDIPGIDGRSDLSAVLRGVNRGNKRDVGVWAALKQITICGLVDRNVRRPVGLKRSDPSFRAELLDGNGKERAIQLRVKVPESPVIVPGPESAWQLHIWNIFENALRHIDLERGFQETRRDLGVVLEVDLRVEEEVNHFSLIVSNNGRRIPAGRLEALDRILGTLGSSRENREARETIQRGDGEDEVSPGVQPESMGRGLAAFSDFLHEIWRSSGENRARVGSVESSRETVFRFYVPKIVV